MNLNFPFPIGTVHIIGIGGIGMSGYAEVLHHLGYKVQGSDMSENANVVRLRSIGIQVAIGHAAENIINGDGQPCGVVVKSTAVKDSNPEIIAAKEQNVPVIPRVALLAELMKSKWCVNVSGTHGKTTTTSMIGHVLEKSGIDPTVINGGIINAYGSNTRMGKSNWMVVESDESDGTFNKLPSVASIITNIDPEHMDYYGDFEAVKEAYVAYAHNLPFYGIVVACIDHPVVAELIPQFQRRVISYGFSDKADLQAVNVRTTPEGLTYDIRVNCKLLKNFPREIVGVKLPMFGPHNVLNSLTTFAIGHHIGIEPAQIVAALAKFSGVKRRFTTTGIVNGVTVIDDYGHHPVEINAVLKAGRDAIAGNGGGRLIAVMQPHRYTRLSSLFDEFCGCFTLADEVIIADVYSAGEEAIAGVNKDALVSCIRRNGKDKVHALENPAALAPLIAGIVKPGDFVICLGAGTITNWAYALPKELEQIWGLHAKKANGTNNMSATISPRDPDGFRFPPGLIERLPEVAGRLTENAALGHMTWFGVGGPAEVLFKPEDREDLINFITHCPKDIPITMLGVASNLIIRDGGVPGVVIRLGREFAGIEADGANVTAGAAALDMNVALTAAKHEIAGLEFLSGIPGTIGGALRMNAGAYGGETKDALISAEVLFRDGTVKNMTPAEMGMSYRHNDLPKDVIFISSLLKGRAGDKAEIEARMDEIKTKRAESQPIRTKTGGSTFANPDGHRAWQLVDQAGCRGFSIGGAEISNLHCNFMINTGGATAADIERLGEEVRKRVAENSGVMLRWEIKRIGIPLEKDHDILEFMKREASQ